MWTRSGKEVFPLRETLTSVGALTAVVVADLQDADGRVEAAGIGGELAGKRRSSRLPQRRTAQRPFSQDEA